MLLDMHIGNERGENLLEELAAPGDPGRGRHRLDRSRDVRGTTASAVLGKPFTIDELESTVARLASLRASAR